MGNNRFRRPANPERLGAYSAVRRAVQSRLGLWIEGNAFLRVNRCSTYLSVSRILKHLTLNEDYNYPSDLTPRKLPVLPNTPVGVVHYFLPPQARVDARIQDAADARVLCSEDYRRLDEACFDT